MKNSWLLCAIRSVLILLFSLQFLFFTSELRAEGLNYYGRIFYQGTPVQSETAEITFQITGNDPLCIIYEEVHSNVIVKDGLINEIIGVINGNSTLTYKPPGLMTVESIFKNTLSFQCQNGGTYNPLAIPERNLIVLFRETPIHSPIKLDAQPIKAVPFAVMAQDTDKFAGKDPSAFLQANSTTDQTKLDQLISKSPALMNLVASVVTSGSGAIDPSLSQGTLSADPNNYTPLLSHFLVNLSGAQALNTAPTYVSGEVHQLNFPTGTSSDWSQARTTANFNLANLSTGVTNNFGTAYGQMNRAVDLGSGNGTLYGSSNHARQYGTGNKGSVIALDGVATYNPASATTASVSFIYGVTAQGQLSPTAPGTVVTAAPSTRGGNFYGMMAPSGVGTSVTAAQLMGAQLSTRIDANNGANVTLDSEYGSLSYGWAHASNSATVNVTNAYGIKAHIGAYQDTGGTAHITNAYSGYFGNGYQTNSGTVDNGYGVYIEAINYGTKSYALYSAGGNNFFAGNVGIGTTSPSKLLHVGSASVSTGGAVANFQNVDGTCTITPAASGSGIACSSDERLKENFEDVQGNYALDQILKLQAVTYNFKTSSIDNRRTGYKAQEVQNIAPEFVRENDDGYLQVYYDAFIPWITESIKTLYNRITSVESNLNIQGRQIASKADKTETESLKAENERLKQENAEIKARLERIEKALNSK